MTLKEQLLLNTREQLKDFARLYNVVGFSKLKKEELCEKLTVYILENAVGFIECFSEEQFEYFKQLVKAGGIINNLTNQRKSQFLGQIGFISLSSKAILLDELILPEEIRALYKNLVKHKKQKELLQQRRAHFNLLSQYKEAAVNLYGVVPISFFKELYEKLENCELDIAELCLWLNKEEYLMRFSSVIDNYIVDESLYAMEEDEYKELIKNTEGKAFYIPEREELLAYADQFYYKKTPQTSALKAYLKEQLKIDEETAEDVVFEIVTDTRIEVHIENNPLRNAIGVLEYLGIEIKNMMQFNELSKLFIEVINTTPMWLNKGYTPLMLNEESLIQLKTGGKIKVGRNMLCPCGSGKKYKKCCGRVQ